jgi:uncharacterized protein YndB with AHSA1/START domain
MMTIMQRTTQSLSTGAEVLRSSSRLERALVVGVAVASLSSVVGCASVPRAGSPENPLQRGPLPAHRINWPARYEPKEASFFVHNQIDIDAPPAAVWNVIVQAETWPSWYEGAENVQVTSATNSVLDARATFTWTTMGLDFTSTVTEFQPPFRLSWESRKSTIQGYHAWLIIPRGAGSRLVTEESQHGFMTTLQKLFVPNKLRRLHDVWLSQIKKRAEAAAAWPPSPVEGPR